MRRRTLVLGVLGCLLVVVPAVRAEGPALVDGVSGVPIEWDAWVAKHGPAAVLMWSSWTPGADEAIDAHAAIAAACREADLELILLDVQEPIADARAVLGSKGIAWIHDRHGALLKQYRVIRVPSLVIVSSKGEALARLEPTAAAVRGWKNQ